MIHPLCVPCAFGAAPSSHADNLGVDLVDEPFRIVVEALDLRERPAPDTGVDLPPQAPALRRVRSEELALDAGCGCGVEHLLYAWSIAGVAFRRPCFSGWRSRRSLNCGFRLFPLAARSRQLDFRSVYCCSNLSVGGADVRRILGRLVRRPHPFSNSRRLIAVNDSCLVPIMGPQ